MIPSIAFHRLNVDFSGRFDGQIRCLLDWEVSRNLEGLSVVVKESAADIPMGVFLPRLIHQSSEAMLDENTIDKTLRYKLGVGFSERALQSNTSEDPRIIRVSLIVSTIGTGLQSGRYHVVELCDDTVIATLPNRGTLEFLSHTVSIRGPDFYGLNDSQKFDCDSIQTASDDVLN